MVVYSIKDLEKLSGVKAHTLRIWEKRYGIINPKRTKTNIRYYLDEDLKSVLNIAFLNKSGIKISHIAKLSNAEINKKVAELSEVSEVFEDQLDALTLSLIEMNEYKFDRIFQTNIDQKGFKATMLEIIYPLLDKLSVMWMIESINKAHERFVINIIRRKTIAAIDKLAVIRNKSVPSFLLYLPREENHELSLLFLHFIIKEMGFEIVNLGLDIEDEDLENAYKILKSDYLLTIFNDSHTQNLGDHIKNLLATFPESKMIVSGLQVTQQNIRSNNNLIITNGIPDILKYLESIKPNTRMLNAV